MKDITVENAPELIKDSEMKILKFKNAIAEIKEKLNKISRLTAASVAVEVTEGGKKTFANATERELETERQLQNDDQYQALKENMATAECQKAEEEINLQYIRDAFSSQRYKMRLGCASRAENAADKFLTGMQILAGIEPLLIGLLHATTNTTGKNGYADSNIPEECPF